MKLKDIINRKSKTYGPKNSHSVSYSWVKSGIEKSKTKSLVIYFSREVLEIARYREGDRTEPEYFDGELAKTGTIVFPIGASEGMLLTGKDGKNKKSGRQIKYSHQNAEADLGCIFPNTGKVEPLRLVKVSHDGKIICELPSTTTNQEKP